MFYISFLSLTSDYLGGEDTLIFGPNNATIHILG